MALVPLMLTVVAAWVVVAGVKLRMQLACGARVAQPLASSVISRQSDGSAAETAVAVTLEEVLVTVALTAVALPATISTDAGLTSSVAEAGAGGGSDEGPDEGSGED
ncbi:MAG: hypothetical protein WDO68_24555 [Gammaproteobacteria bacterium]